MAYHVYVGLSGEYVARLKRGALGFLRAADGADDVDLAAFFAEQTMQLTSRPCSMRYSARGLEGMS